ncbi:uncharacterized protein LOC132166403 [Corylus avellana]|uniref:uncharacterized protein LOC132166403 n=1 Tax=Corylus avellana TaxID=13451 RepID=UPI00286C81BB|nr:uncharacterized protein LOC132166403 [Corylus avellana]
MMNISVSQVRDKPEKVLKAKKKVTFDPNVKIYEYVSCNEVSDFYMENEGNYQNCKETDDELDYEDGYLDNIDDLSDRDDNGGLMDNDLYDDDEGIVELRRTISAPPVFTEEFDSPMPRGRHGYVHAVLNPVENLSQWRTVKAKGAPSVRTGKENFVSNQEPQVPFSSEPSVKEFSFSLKPKGDQAKMSNQKIPWSSSSRCLDEMSTISTAGTYWKHSGPSFVGRDKAYGSMIVQDKRMNQLEEVKPIRSNPYARDRSASHNPLLMPVENLAQWKALKAKGALEF